MSISLIKILSCAIFIAERNKNKILTILLKDYAKARMSKSQFIFILLLVVCYRENNIFINGPYHDKANNSWLLSSSKTETVDNYINQIKLLTL